MTSPKDNAAASVRLKVAYKTPESLLGEYTRSVGLGGVALETARAVPLGTRFVFELHATGVERSVEVVGEVVQVTPRQNGRFLLNVRYDPGSHEEGLKAVLQRIFDTHAYEKMRKHPRIPLHFRATEAAPFSPAFLVRDLSRGGVGIEVEAQSLPTGVRVGQPFLLEVNLSLGTLQLFGEVVWTTSAGVPPGVSPGFGVQFGRLRPETVERLEKLLSLATLPPAPWRARVSFGMDAVGRMPG